MLEAVLIPLFLIFSLSVVMYSAHHATHYSVRVAKAFNLPKYIIGFLVVAVISILPELLISVTSALEGIPAFGLGTLFGSNVADLSLIVALVILISGRNIKVESKIIKNSALYISIMLLPLFFGFNGYYSRLEGIILIIAGLGYYYFITRGKIFNGKGKKERFSLRDLLLLLASMAALLIGANFTVKYGTQFAGNLNVSPVLIGMFVVGLGTTLPELFFSIKAAKKRHDSLALGDILGTVIADATIVVGIIATISPFLFDKRIVYVTGLFMVLATLLLFFFMRSGKVLTKKEACLLLLFYLAFITAEMTINRLS